VTKGAVIAASQVELDVLISVVPAFDTSLSCQYIPHVRKIQCRGENPAKSLFFFFIVKRHEILLTN
jgi:hypothetical protein